MFKNLTDTDKRNLKYLAAITGAVLLYKFFQKNQSDTGGATDPTGNGGATTIPAGFDAKKIALKLYDLMKDMGSDNMRIVAEFNNINESQFALVRNAFGRKSYNWVTGNQINPNPFTNLPLEPLEKWLYHELTDKQYSVLKLKYPKYL